MNNETQAINVDHSEKFYHLRRVLRFQERRAEPAGRLTGSMLDPMKYDHQAFEVKAGEIVGSSLEVRTETRGTVDGCL